MLPDASDSDRRRMARLREQWGSISRCSDDPASVVTAAQWACPAGYRDALQLARLILAGASLDPDSHMGGQSCTLSLAAVVGALRAADVHWPRGIAARGELRHDVGHLVDFVRTLLELAGVEPASDAGAPALPGLSLLPTFAQDGNVPREDVFFHHEGNRALRQGDYKLVSAREDNNRWELFDLATDRAEQRDLAAAEPDRVRRMAARWQQLQDEFPRDAGL
jgi:hypothetical protein